MVCDSLLGKIIIDDEGCRIPPCHQKWSWRQVCMCTMLAVVSELLAHGTPREGPEGRKVLKRRSLILAVVPSLLVEDRVKGNSRHASLMVTDDEWKL